MAKTTTFGKFITLEGIEGVGKTTQMAFVAQYLAAKNITTVTTLEPGGTDFGQKIRGLLLDDTAQKMDSNTELLLMFADRNEHVKTKILPELERGKWVLSDRFADSSFAYQGGGRQLDSIRVAQLSRWVLDDFNPDLTLLLDAPVEFVMERVARRGDKDRIEQEDVAFFERVRASYLARAAQFPVRIKVIDATQSVESTNAKIREVLDQL